MTTINPYLTFNGDCEAAFNFYRSVFGGDFTFIGKFKDMPPNPDFPVPEADQEKIMHVSLPVSKETILMGSDSSASFSKDLMAGNNITISVNTDSVEEVTRIYLELSAGGTIKMELSKTFWGAYFGQLIDQFGINWMVNCELAEHRDFEAEHRKDGK